MGTFNNTYFEVFKLDHKMLQVSIIHVVGESRIIIFHIGSPKTSPVAIESNVGRVSGLAKVKFILITVSTNSNINTVFTFTIKFIVQFNFYIIYYK